MYNDQSSSYHTPVLLEEAIEFLKINPSGIYIDATFGGGGHSRPILDRLTAKGRLFGFDQDEQAQDNLIDDMRFTFVRANFRYIPQFMRYYGVREVDGILADLGVSSHHFDDPSRGFSYRFDTELDMRMNQSAKLKASDILNRYDERSLQMIFSEFGELRNAKTFARKICQKRSGERITSVGQLLELIQSSYRGDQQKYTSQVFQALRIAVNEELEVLKQFMSYSWDLLATGGRMVILTYHSIEDKIVKNMMKHELGGPKRDQFGRSVEVLKDLTKKPILPSEEEINRNSRAASAKLRAIEKI